MAKKHLRFRRFQVFVPEVAGGVAYSDISFQTFSTDTNSDGQLVVTEAGEEEFRKITFNAMINWNLFITNSPVNPLLQIGTGMNGGFPTFFVGGGFRFSSPPLKRMAVSFGAASTWRKELNELKVGDVISGAADLENDLENVFNWPPKPYIAFQINF